MASSQTHEGDRDDPGAQGTRRSEDPLAAAYQERDLQLREARAALGEAVHTLRLELAQERRENAALQEKHNVLHDEWKALGAEVEWLRDQRAVLTAEVERLEQELRAVKNMRVVRWSARPRRIFRRSPRDGG